jgi:hypothetical protein
MTKIIALAIVAALGLIACSDPPKPAAPTPPAEKKK